MCEVLVKTIFYRMVQASTEIMNFPYGFFIDSQGLYEAKCKISYKLH